MRRAFAPCRTWISSNRLSLQQISDFELSAGHLEYTGTDCRSLVPLSHWTSDILRCHFHQAAEALYKSRTGLPKGKQLMRDPAYQRGPPPPGASSSRVSVPPPAVYLRPGRQHALARGAKQTKNAKILIGHRLPRPNYGRIGATRKAAAAAIAAEEQAVVVRKDIWDEDALSHTSGMQLLFLGTGLGHPTEARRSSCIALRKSKATWLFDCGEDTQRQVHRQPLVRQGKVDRIFITNSRSANVLGLPGMLCTISAAREVGLDTADVPLHVYGPPGLANFIRPMLVLSDTYLSLPVIVHEFVDYAVDAEQMEQPEQLDRRSNLYRVLLPPDKLNPMGFYDGEVRPFLSRARRTTQASLKTEDERANLRPLPLPPPGDPSAGPLAQEDLVWTIRCDREFSIQAVSLPNSPPSWGYIISEASRVGKLDIEKARALRLTPGKQLARLKAGEALINEDGVRVTPDQVVGPDIPGRKLAVLGETSDSLAITSAVQDADVIIHSASRQEESVAGQLQTVSTVEMAGQLGKACNAAHVVLYRFSPTDTFTDGSSSSSGAPLAQHADHSTESNGFLDILLRAEGGGADCRPNSHMAGMSSESAEYGGESARASGEASQSVSTAGLDDAVNGLAASSSAEDALLRRGGPGDAPKAGSEALSSAEDPSLRREHFAEAVQGGKGALPQQRPESHQWQRRPAPGGYISKQAEGPQNPLQESEGMAALVQAAVGAFGKPQVTVTEDLDLLSVERKVAPTAQSR